MTVSSEDLIEAIRSLPDPDKYQYLEYKCVVKTLQEVTPFVEPKRDHHPFIEIPFRKRRTTDGKMIWTIDI